MQNFSPKPGWFSHSYNRHRHFLSYVASMAPRRKSKICVKLIDPESDFKKSKEFFANQTWKDVLKGCELLYPLEHPENYRIQKYRKNKTGQLTPTDDRKEEKVLKKGQKSLLASKPVKPLVTEVTQSAVALPTPKRDFRNHTCVSKYPDTEDEDESDEDTDPMAKRTKDSVIDRAKKMSDSDPVSPQYAAHKRAQLWMTAISRNTTDIIPETSTVAIPQIPTAAIPQTSTAAIPQILTALITPETLSAAIPQTPTAEILQTTATSIPQTSTAEIPQTPVAAIPQTSATSIPQTSTAAISQTSTAVIPQTSTAEILQTSTAAIPQTLVAAIRQTSAAVVQQTSTSEIPQTSTAVIPQTSTGGTHLNKEPGSGQLCLTIGNVNYQQLSITGGPAAPKRTRSESRDSTDTVETPKLKRPRQDDNTSDQDFKEVVLNRLRDTKAKHLLSAQKEWDECKISKRLELIKPECTRKVYHLISSIFVNPDT
ncbi:mucin-5AC-like isoform X2 [Folsomia candida]|uniref:mucin-5AC-like isoform X2 n=1 Tax=Folsomia candida TaxID=158441 RepID=UPI001604FD67|nr:mucin-5AC-like isoform X2 [Folsomia candida]